MNPLAVGGKPRYRTVAETRIVEMLLLYGWVYEVRRGERAAAEHEAGQALNRWMGLGLKFEESAGGERYFDPIEVANFLKWAGICHGDRFWEERFIATGRRLVLGMHHLEVPPQSPLPSPALLGPQRFHVTVRREFNLDQSAPGTRVRLRLPIPLEDEGLRDLGIVFVPPPDIDVDFRTTPGRLDAQLIVPLKRAETLAVEVSFIAYPTGPITPSAPELTQSEDELYTRLGEGLIQVSPRIQALAAKLAGTVKDPWTLMQGFWNFMLDHFTCGVVRYEELNPSCPTDWVLEAGCFDCQLGSALLVALCRARGIAARVVSGYLLYRASPSHHYWAEVWTNTGGWVPVDTVCSDLSTKGRDKSWRDYFVGRLDYRMKTQCLPRLFNGTPTVRWPSAWYMLPRVNGEGIEVGIFAYDSGALVYRDLITVFRETGASPC